MSRFITGSLNALSDKISLNGKTLSKAQLAVLAAVIKGDAFRKTGTIRTAGNKGRAENVYTVDTEAAFSLSFASIEGLNASDSVPTFSEVVVNGDGSKSVTVTEVAAAA